jgi:hypothetical protein
MYGTPSSCEAFSRLSTCVKNDISVNVVEIVDRDAIDDKSART